VYGWRCRIGLIVPSSNIVMEHEFNTLLHAVQGVSVHATRMFLSTEGVEELLRMREDCKRASRELKTAEVDVIAYACTSGSFVKGLDFDKKIISEIEEETGITATTTSTAVVQALTALKVKKIAVGTPYPDEVNEKGKAFLENSGFTVTAIAGLNVTKAVEFGNQEPYTAYNLAKRINTDDAECIFLSCTNFRTIDIIDALERRLKKPVISANQATLWQIVTLKELGITIKGHGILLDEYL
jgi:maleate isomerase